MDGPYSDDESGYPLSPERFAEKVKNEIATLTKALVMGVSQEEYHLLRGKITQSQRILEIYLNKKGRG